MKFVIIRAAIIAVIIGTVLTLVNQSGWVAGTEPLQVLQLVLVFALPFGVVMAAQIVAARQAQRDSPGPTAAASSESFASTIGSHGIPARAVAIAAVFGSLNAALVVANTLLHGNDVSTIEMLPLAQAYVLPLVFGLLSQAIAYRRLRFQTARVPYLDNS